jgi:hypothetical protein
MRLQCTGLALDWRVHKIYKQARKLWAVVRRAAIAGRCNRFVTGFNLKLYLQPNCAVKVVPVYYKRWIILDVIRDKVKGSVLLVKPFRFFSTRGNKY